MQEVFAYRGLSNEKTRRSLRRVSRLWIYLVHGNRIRLYAENCIGKLDFADFLTAHIENIYISH